MRCGLLFCASRTLYDALLGCFVGLVVTLAAQATPGALREPSNVQSKNKSIVKGALAPRAVRDVIRSLTYGRLDPQHYDVSLKLLQEAHQKAPKSPKWTFYLANVYALQARQRLAVDCDGGDPLRLALRYYQQVCEATQEHKNQWHYFAQNHLDLLSHRHFNRGIQYYHKTGYARALENFDRYHMLNPEHAPVQLYQAIAAQQAGNPMQAVAHYKAYLALKKDNPVAYVALSELLLLHQKNQKRAVEVLQEGLRELPYDDELLQGLYRVLKKSGQLDAYTKHLVKKIAGDMRNAHLHYQWATLQQWIAQDSEKKQQKTQRELKSEKEEDKKSMDNSLESCTAQQAFQRWYERLSQTKREQQADAIRQSYSHAAYLDLRSFAPSLKLGIAYYNKTARMIDATQDLAQPTFEQLVVPLHDQLLKWLQLAKRYLNQAKRRNTKSAMAVRYYKKTEAYMHYLYDQQDIVEAAFSARKRIQDQMAEARAKQAPRTASTTLPSWVTQQPAPSPTLPWQSPTTPGLPWAQSATPQWPQHTRAANTVPAFKL